MSCRVAGERVRGSSQPRHNSQSAGEGKLDQNYMTRDQSEGGPTRHTGTKLVAQHCFTCCATVKFVSWIRQQVSTTSDVHQSCVDEGGVSSLVVIEVLVWK